MTEAHARLLTAATTIAAAAGLAAAALDDNVQWAGLSHLPASDLTPVIPQRGDDFSVRFQTFQTDITEANVVRLADGLMPARFAAEVIGTRGPYAIWEATVDGVNADTLGYAIEVIDGSDTDYIGSAGPIDDLNDSDTFFLDLVNFTSAPYGSNPIEGGTVFKVWGPGNQSVHVAGTFNNFNDRADPLTRYGEDWVGVVPGASAGDRYKFVFDGDIWKPDAHGRSLVNGTQDTVIVDRDDYQWAIEFFTPPPVDQMVVYNAHVGNFPGRNDPNGPVFSRGRFIDIAARADYLAELGVNVVYLQPVHEHPGSNSAGYNSVSAYALEIDYGSPRQFKFMVDRLHQRGIAVWVDIVYNHFDGGPENFLWDYNGRNIYYGDNVTNTQWGPQVDMTNPRVREYLLDSFDMLFDDYKIDGLRFDAVSHHSFAVPAGPVRESNELFMRQVNDKIDQRHIEKWNVAEVYGDDTFNTTPTGLGGFGFDAQYHQEFRDAVRGATFDAAFGDPDMGRLASAMWGSRQFLTAGRAFNFAQNHDESWPLTGGQRIVRTIDPGNPITDGEDNPQDGAGDSRWALGRMKLANSVTLLSRGIPMILQGDEWAEDEGWNEDSRGNPNRIDWSHKDRFDGYWEYFKDLINLRTEDPALGASAPLETYHLNEGANVMAVQRFQVDGSSYVALINYSNTDFPVYRIGLPRAGEWGVIMNSESAFYDGVGNGTTGDVQVDPIPYDGFGQSAELNLPAHSLLLLQHEPRYLNADCLADIDRDRIITLDDAIAIPARIAAGDDLNGDGASNFIDAIDALRDYDEGCVE